MDKRSFFSFRIFLARSKLVFYVCLTASLVAITMPTAREQVADAAGCTTAPCAVTINVNTGSEDHYAYGYRGLNNEFQKGIVEFTDQNVIDWTKALDLGWIRWPGGTNVNFFNWKTGLTDTEYLAQYYQHNEHAEANYYKYMDFYKMQRSTQIPERLSDFKDFLQKVGARTAIAINPAMDPVSKVYDLAKFVKDNNIPVLYWELGNEPFFYQSDPKIYANTPDYLAKMKPYRDTIKDVLPDAKVLISYHNTPDSNWNNAIYNYSNPYWDGINFHRYKGGVATDLKDTNEAIATHVSVINNGYIARMQNTSQPAFIPENGVDLGGKVGETAYHGIYNAETLLRTLLQRYGTNTSSNIKYMGGFRLFNGYLQPANRYMNASIDLYQRGQKADATGYDFDFYFAAPAVYTHIMDLAVNNSSSYWGTTVTGGADVDRLNSAAMPAIYAQAFRGSYGNKNYLVITNKSDKAHTAAVQLNGTPYGGTFTKVYAAAPNGNPLARNSAAAPQLVQEQTASGAANPISIPAYAIVRLEWSPASPQADKMPQEPWITHADAVTTGAASLKWLPADGANSYTIKYGTSPSSLTNMIPEISSCISSYVVTGLSANTTFYFKVEAVGTSGTTASANVLSLTTAVPATPLLRSAYVERSGAVGVEWQSVPGATGYKVRYKLDGGSCGSPIDVDNAVGTLVEGLNNGQKYWFQVAAYNAYGTSAYSAEDPAYPNTNNPFAPHDVKVSAKTATTATLTWEPSYDETFMGFFEDGDGTSSGWTVQAGSAYTAVNHPDTSRATKVYKATASGQQIVTRGSASWDDYEIEANIDVTSYDSSGKVGVIGRFQDINNYYYFTYDNSTTSFRLAKYVNGTTVLIASKTLTELSAQGVKPNVADMNVRLVLEGTRLKAMVNDKLIIDVTDSSIGSGEAGLWANQDTYFDEVIIRVPNATSFKVYRSTQPDTGYTQVANNVTGTSWTDTNLQSGVTYYYKLKGENGSGDASVGFSNIAPKP
ncbi:hypothetical protein ACFQI7_08730 [Paenibacillus allorhizosphaerae]|uniref:Fibronectin type-III domain-containing protein n=1 Tax=Paenibacillus allorhizosphaerae TaxID=2849866 RepID=A0ABN7TMA7_9BACL|nr:fibronectin type III domain-containing protein [Paenibacillus allorhizosphaerae]CAG7639593.1 hypothetical protein PAECIP111802_02560 [Paenibacillus allorhizosphaerae]